MLLSLFEPPQIKPQPKIEDVTREEDYQITVKGEPVPVRIVFEHRFNNRVTVNKNGILIRISNKQDKEEQRKNIDKFLKWAKEKLGDKPELLENLPQRKYVDGEMLKVGDHEFRLNIFYHPLNKSTARIHNNHIAISLARGLAKDVEQDTTSYLIAKCLCKYFQPIISERVHELNNRHFRKQLNSVKAKYTTSYWGLCNSDGNITISVRLMFAPQRVIDYVIVHELAHLLHMDHSPRFWKVVENVMPDYRLSEKHLEEFNYKYYL